jgi:integrase
MPTWVKGAIDAWTSATSVSEGPVLRRVNRGDLVPSTVGTPVDDRKILKEFNSLVEAAKLPKRRFHDLRHACISLLAAQNVPLKVIAEIVGHSDIRLTQNVYQHIYAEAKTEAANKVDELLISISAAPATPVATKTVG